MNIRLTLLGRAALAVAHPGCRATAGAIVRSAAPGAGTRTTTRASCLRSGTVGGCTVGPNYHPAPPTQTRPAPLVSVSAAAETAAEPPDDWWRLYHDPTLDKLLEEAFKANTDLKAAEANLRAASAVLDIARDAFLPADGSGNRRPPAAEMPGRMRSSS